MNDFVEQEWQSFCSRLRKTAAHLANGQNDIEKQLTKQADDFIDSNNPTSYTELLTATAAGSRLATSWQSAVHEKMTYTDCENHEPMPVPTESIAEQAEQVRSDD